MNGNARSFAAVLLGVLLLVIPAAVRAQFDTGTILGTVRDSSGAVAPEVSVTLRNTQTGITSTLQTDQQGNYQFGNLRIGAYEVTAEKTGFSKAVVLNIGLVVNARQRVDVVMQIGTVAEQVVVTGAVALLETDSSEKGQVVDGEQIEALPLNGRSYADLALLAPGVSESNQNDIAISGTGREGSFNANGLRNTANNFQLDGVDNNQYGTSNQGFSNQVISPSPDSVAEFKVQTNSYSAEYGRSGGAVVNAAYRSGTNRFHGSLWDFTRNTALNAIGFFRPAGGVKPSLNRHQFGFTFGGPIRRDRTFFFVDYEGFRQTQKTLTYTTIPTMDHRRGILTVPVTDPFTAAMYPAGTPIPMTGFASKVLNELPEPNVPGATGSNYQKAVANRSVYDKANLKIDHKVSDTLSAFVRLSQGKNNAFQAPNISGPSGGNQNGVVTVMSQQLVIGATKVVTSRSVLEVRLGISRTKAGKHPPFLGGASMSELYGITGLPEERDLTGGLTPQSITGYTQLGRQSTNPQSQNPANINPRASYTWTAGRQTLKLGFEFAAINVDVNDTNPNYGLDSYTSQFSRPAGRASSNLYNLADFMFGLRSQYGFATRVVAPMRRRSYYGYLQDDIKVTPRLTLNVGLRYEFVTPYAVAGDRMSNFDPATNQLVLAKGGSLRDRSLVNPDFNDFGPRFGFAYRLGSRTVFRGGYGIGYVHFNRVASAELLATNYPFVTRATVTQSIAGVPLCTGSIYRSGCFRTTQMGYPADLPNDVVLHVPSDLRSGYIQNWQFAVQRQVAKQTMLEAAYAGNHAIKQVLLADLNQARVPLPGENVNATLNARRPYQGFGTISTLLPAGFSSYHSLQVKVEHRASKSLNLLNSFTWSKAIDNSSQVLEEPSGSTGTPQNIYNVNADRGISGYNVPVLNVTSAVWNVPVGKGRMFGKNFSGLLESVLGGWQISGINTMRSGRTVNFRYITSGPTPVTAGLPTYLGGVTLRPNLLGDPLAPEEQRSIDNYFNRANVVAPPATAPFGNAGRNIVRGYPFYQLNLGLQKKFNLPFGERMSMQFRAEAFNLLNKTNFGAPNADRSSGSFGLIRSTYPGRQMQGSLKLVF
ncbi:MAG: TonB-dependent receptor [Acidobacteria bacterium]|nr:TonB-dependent receptor [Acidobacteriota bacterium]